MLTPLLACTMAVNVQDGGHLLLRVTQLTASEPADLVPPIATRASSSSSQGGSTGSTGGQLGSQYVAAAAAAVAGPGAAAAGNDDGSSGDDQDEGLQDRIVAVLKQSVSQAQGQVGTRKRPQLAMLGVCWQ